MDIDDVTNEVRAALRQFYADAEVPVRVSRHGRACLELTMEDGSNFQLQIVQSGGPFSEDEL